MTCRSFKAPHVHFLADQGGGRQYMCLGRSNNACSATSWATCQKQRLTVLFSFRVACVVDSIGGMATDSCIQQSSATSANEGDFAFGRRIQPCNMSRLPMPIDPALNLHFLAFMRASSRHVDATVSLVAVPSTPLASVASQHRHWTLRCVSAL